MPWHVSESDSCPASRPWAVIKDDDGEVEGCHATKAAAEAQMAALYAGERKSPPRDDLVRSMPSMEFRAADDTADIDGLGTLTGHFSIFDTWYEVDSLFEGRFMERIRPGAFTRTFAEDRPQMRVTFQHGMDPQLGDKVLGPIDNLEEDGRGARYDVPLLDTSYNRDLLPGLRAGVYGSSFRFSVRKEEWEQEPKRSAHNPDRLPERSVTDVRTFEFGPVTYPASPKATAGIRSLTDEYRSARASPEREPEPPPEPPPPPSPVPARKEPPMTAPATPAPDSLDEYRTVPEMRAGIEERKGVLSGIDAEHTGRELPADIQAEWDRVTSEVERLNVRIGATEMRRAQLERFAATEMSTIAGDGGQPAPFAPAVVKTRMAAEIYDLAEIRSRSRSDDEHRAMLRDNAMRAVETSSYGYLPGLTSDNARENVGRLLDFKDTPDKALARRILITGSPVYKRAFGKYLRGEQMSPEEQRAAALAVGVDTTGGFAVPFAFDPTIIAIGAWTSVNPYRQACRIETIVGTDTWQALTATAISAVYATEAAAATEQGPTFARPELIAKRAHAFVTVSYEMMQDRPDIGAELTVLFQEAKDTNEENQFSVGVGTTVFPQGVFLDGAFTAVETIGNNVVAGADFDALEAALPIRHRPQAVWFLSRAGIRAVQAFETAFGKYFGGTNYASVGNPVQNPGGNTGLRLLGYPVYETPSAPYNLTSASIVAVFANPSRYVILDRVGMSIRTIADMLNGATPSFPTGEHGIYAFWRNTARVIDANAGRQLKINAP